MTRKLIVGYGNSVHDPAIAIAEGGALYAEAFERHTQCKRSIDSTALYYSARPIRHAMADLGGWPVRNADVVTRSTWNYEGVTRPPGIVPEELGVPAGESVFDHQLAWALAGYPPHNVPPSAAAAMGIDLGVRVTRKPALRHHLSHAAAAVYTSPFTECVVMIADGAGEDESTSFYYFHDDRFEPLNRTPIRHSLGILYATVTSLCGFSAIEGEEWKVMGLAAYGEPNEAIYGYFRERIEVRGLDLRLHDEIVLGSVRGFRGLAAVTGGFRAPTDPHVERAADLAHNFQRAFEETVVELAANAFALGLSKHLAYAGGCALNSSANGRILAGSGFARLHVPSAPADDGTALGAVLYEKHAVRREPRAPEVMTPYLGSRINEQALTRVRTVGGGEWIEHGTDGSLCEDVAARLAGGAIVGWVQGRAEFGPRALGNRSILAAPFPVLMKDWINARVKFREEYRPLAPAILHEFGPEYFEDYQESPYMERTLVVKPGMRARMPAGVDRDGTGRLQTVKEAWNPRFHQLLTAFHAQTGVPVLLNTSFNVMGRPIVHRLEDAIAVFHSTGLDVLVVDRFVLLKHP